MRILKLEKTMCLLAQIEDHSVVYNKDEGGRYEVWQRMPLGDTRTKEQDVLVIEGAPFKFKGASLDMKEAYGFMPGGHPMKAQAKGKKPLEGIILALAVTAFAVLAVYTLVEAFFK